SISHAHIVLPLYVDGMMVPLAKQFEMNDLALFNTFYGLNLVYLIITRLDIAYAILVNYFVVSPTLIYWITVLFIFCYFHDTQISFIFLLRISKKQVIVSRPSTKA
ncbi:hypothetical protein CR513_58685, partial [Mucuna pruriens]